MMQYLCDNLLENKLIDLCILFSETAKLSGDFSEILDNKKNVSYQHLMKV